MADRADELAAALSALLDLPARLDRVEQQQAQILAALGAMASAGSLAPVSLDAAAPALGKSVATLRRLAAAGRLPGALRVGRTWKVDLGAMRGASGDDEVGRLAQEARAR